MTPRRLSELEKASGGAPGSVPERCWRWPGSCSSASTTWCLPACYLPGTREHTRALYFAVTIFSTVGFGDITPKTDLARIIVSIQMLLDLVIIGAVVRLLLTAAQAGLARARDSSVRS